MGDNPYCNEDGWPILRESWVLYLDALGTKAEAETLTNERLRDLSLSEGWYHRFLHHVGADATQRSAHFTDDVVVARPDDADDCAHSLRGYFDIVHSASSYMVGMAIVADRLVRGGFARGPACIDTNPMAHDGAARFQIVHGMGIIDAVMLEKDVAVQPRVVLGPAVATRIAHCLQATAATPDSFIVPKPRVLRDRNDGVDFVDHLGAVIRDGDPNLNVRDANLEPYSTEAIMTLYRSFIMGGLQGGVATSKYEWLAAYYDYVATTSTVGEPINGPNERFEPSDGLPIDADGDAH